MRTRVAKIDGFYVSHWFPTREEAEAFKELTADLAPGTAAIRSSGLTSMYHETRLGKIILAFFVLPNRSYHLEDILAHAEEQSYSAHSVRRYVGELVRSGHLKVLGPQTYIRKHDPATSVRTTVDLEASGDDPLAGLVAGQACGCGCGDKG